MYNQRSAYWEMLLEKDTGDFIGILRSRDGIEVGLKDEQKSKICKAVTLM